MVSFMELITIVSKHNMDYRLHYLNINNYVNISANFKRTGWSWQFFFNLKKEKVLF